QVARALQVPVATAHTDQERDTTDRDG
ncbi:hypothetical protein KIPB_016274, partial [Kipferlia bialata]